MLVNQRIPPPGNGAEPTTPALRRRLAEVGLGPGQRCRICGCNIDSDPEADRKLPACSSCKVRPEAQRLRNPQPWRSFTEAEKSLIRKVHGYLPPLQLLGILNDRLHSDLGAGAQPYTVEQLHAEILSLPGAKPGASHGWAGLRKLLAQAKRAGTLEQINEQLINDFAVVFSLSPKELMRMKDVLLQPEED